MAQILDIITHKTGWKKKIFKEEVTSKWFSELETHNVNKIIFETALHLLQNQDNENSYDNEDEVLDWHTQLCITSTDFKVRCSCNCYVCKNEIWEEEEEEEVKLILIDFLNL
jgi:hypothetical protein